MTKIIAATTAMALLLLATLSATVGQFSYGFPGFPGYQGYQGYPGYQGVYQGNRHYHHFHPFSGYEPYQGVIVGLGPPGQVLVPTTTVTTQPVLVPLVPVSETVQELSPPQQQQQIPDNSARVVYPHQVVRPRVVPVNQVIRAHEGGSAEGDMPSGQGNN